MILLYWLDDEFVPDGKAHPYADTFEECCKETGKLVEVKRFNNYNDFNKSLCERLPNCVILDVEVYLTADDFTRQQSPCPEGFYCARDAALSRDIPYVVFTGTRDLKDASPDFKYSIKNASAFLKKFGDEAVGLYECLFDDSKGILLRYNFPNYPFFDDLFNNNWLPEQDVLTGEVGKSTSEVIKDILTEYENGCHDTTLINNIRSILEWIYRNDFKTNWADVIPHTIYGHWNHENLNRFFFALWSERQNIDSAIMPDEIKLAIANVWEGGSTMSHPNNEKDAQHFIDLLNSNRNQRLVFDSFLLFMEWYAIYKKLNLAERLKNHPKKEKDQLPQNKKKKSKKQEKNP